MGLGSIHVSTPERRDRLWLLNAFAIALLTLLGAAGEALGYDRYLKSNTTKTHPLAIPAGLHALRIDPHNAGGAIAAVDRTVHHDARRTPGLCRYFRGHLKMRGVVRAKTAEAAALEILDAEVRWLASTRATTVIGLKPKASYASTEGKLADNIVEDILQL